LWDSKWLVVRTKTHWLVSLRKTGESLTGRDESVPEILPAHLLRRQYQEATKQYADEQARTKFLREQMEDVTAKSPQDYLRTVSTYIEALERENEDLRRNPIAQRLPSTIEDDLRIDMAGVLSRMRIRDHLQRIAAKQEIERLGAAAAGPLLRLIKRESVRRAHRNRVISIFSIAATLLGLGGVAAAESRLRLQ